MNYRVSIVLALAISAAILGGCATSATHQAMTVLPQDNAVVNSKLKSAVRIGTVTGGQETQSMGASQVDNAGFKKALENSLANAGYLALTDIGAPYTLSAELYVLDQPAFGLTFNVRSSVVYKLRGNGSAKDFQIHATGTATVSDAFPAIKRLRIANERSIFESIKALLKELQSF